MLAPGRQKMPCIRLLVIICIVCVGVTLRNVTTPEVYYSHNRGQEWLCGEDCGMLGEQVRADDRKTMPVQEYQVS